MNRPPQVRVAVSLLWIGLLIDTVGTGVAILLEPVVIESPDQRRLIFGTLAVYAAITILYASLIYLVGRRGYWARLLLFGLILALIIATIVGYVIWPGEFDTDPWWVWGMKDCTTRGRDCCACVALLPPGCQLVSNPTAGIEYVLTMRWSGP